MATVQGPSAAYGPGQSQGSGGLSGRFIGGSRASVYSGKTGLRRSSASRYEAYVEDKAYRSGRQGPARSRHGPTGHNNTASMSTSTTAGNRQSVPTTTTSEGRNSVAWDPSSPNIGPPNSTQTRKPSIRRGHAPWQKTGHTLRSNQADTTHVPRAHPAAFSSLARSMSQAAGTASPPLRPSRTRSTRLSRQPSVRAGPLNRIRTLWRRFGRWRRRRKLYFTRAELSRKPSFLVTPDLSSLNFKIRSRDVLKKRPSLMVKAAPRPATGTRMSGPRLQIPEENGSYPSVPSTNEVTAAQNARLNSGSIARNQSVQKIGLPLRTDGMEYYDAVDMTEANEPIPAFAPPEPPIGATNGRRSGPGHARKETETSYQDTGYSGDSRRATMIMPGPESRPEVALQSPGLQYPFRASYKTEADTPVLQRQTWTGTVGSESGTNDRNAPLVFSVTAEPFDVTEAMDFVTTWGSYLRRSIAVRAIIRKEIKSLEQDEEIVWRQSSQRPRARAFDSDNISYSSESSDSSYSSDYDSGASLYSSSQLSRTLSEQSRMSQSSRQSTTVTSGMAVEIPRKPSPEQESVRRAQSVLRKLPNRYSALFGASPSVGASGKGPDHSQTLQPPTRPIHRRREDSPPIVAQAPRQGPSAQSSQQTPQPQLYKPAQAQLEPSPHLDDTTPQSLSHANFNPTILHTSSDTDIANNFTESETDASIRKSPDGLNIGALPTRTSSSRVASRNASLRIPSGASNEVHRHRAKQLSWSTQPAPSVATVLSQPDSEGLWLSRSVSQFESDNGLRINTGHSAQTENETEREAEPSLALIATPVLPARLSSAGQGHVIESKWQTVESSDDGL